MDVIRVSAGLTVVLVGQVVIGVIQKLGIMVVVKNATTSGIVYVPTKNVMVIVTLSVNSLVIKFSFMNFILSCNQQSTVTSYDEN